ncbi:MAG: hypothetical protein AB7R00_10805 [Kofleriaceae bacterium]
MQFGKAAPKLALSCSRRRIRLGVSHHGNPSAWTAPTKDNGSNRVKPNKKRR